MSSPKYVRAGQIARGPGNADPLIPISVSTWWRWSAAGIAPRPIKLAPGTSVWLLEDVLEFIRRRSGEHK